jgi:DNA mismatch endonuclease, patch repair protein
VLGVGPWGIVVAMSPRPTPKSAVVSAQMKRMPRSGTGPELAVRRALHRRGLRYRVSPRDVPGRPDLVFTRARLAVFIDGCFWHACPEHGTLPKNNREWWEAKFVGNRERDRRKDRLLEEDGWMVLHFWEHEDVLSVADTVVAAWRARTGRPDGSSST